MSENLKLGQIIITPQERDAIHIAVVPVVAGDDLNPGQTVKVQNGKAMYADRRDSDIVGVVDPYLEKMVDLGQTFWLFLAPGSITSLRHDWTHPAFPVTALTAPDKAASEQWLRNFINSADCPDYDTVIAGAQGWFNTKEPDYYSSGGYIDGEYLHFNGWDAHGEIPPEFWTHIEIVTGVKAQVKPAYFSCSC